MQLAVINKTQQVLFNKFFNFENIRRCIAKNATEDYTLNHC